MGEANVEKSLPGLEEGLANNTGASGRRGAPLGNARFQPSRNEATDIDGRTFTGHALDQMQNRGIPLSAVNEALQHGTAEPNNTKGTTAFFDAVNGIKVIVDTSTGRVITVISQTSKKGAK